MRSQHAKRSIQVFNIEPVIIATIKATVSYPVEIDTAIIVVVIKAIHG
jgi:hypothetical protein